MPLWRVERADASVRVTISPRRLRVRAGGCLALALGFLAYAIFVDDFILWRVLIGLFAPVPAVIGVAAWRSASKSASNIVFVEIVDDGIRFEKAGLIRWDEIDEIGVCSIMGQQALGIWTVDPDLVAKRIGKRWARVLSRINRVFGWPPSSISAAAVPIGSLLEEIRVRQPEMPLLRR
jgi:hypothetical protein